jgi:adenylosuccinate synthase
VALKYSAMVNGITRIAITKLDVLDDFDEIRVCVAYEAPGKRLRTFPTDAKTLESVHPVYETLPGWRSDIAGARTVGDLPPNARAYIETLGRITGTTVWLVSVGPRRDQTITLS